MGLGIKLMTVVAYLRTMYVAHFHTDELFLRYNDYTYLVLLSWAMLFLKKVLLSLPLYKAAIMYKFSILSEKKSVGKVLT